MKRLLLAALTCGGCLIPGAVMAATTGEIIVTGNIGGSCSVEGANLTFVQQPIFDSLNATGQATWSSTSANTVFSLSAPQISTPPTEQQGIVYVGSVYVDFRTASPVFDLPGGPILGAVFQGSSDSVTPGAPFNGPVSIQAEISENSQGNILPAGDYTLSATASCIIP